MEMDSVSFDFVLGTITNIINLVVVNVVFGKVQCAVTSTHHLKLIGRHSNGSHLRQVDDDSFEHYDYSLACCRRL